MENNIIILPEDLVDKIAAGEVVERPASVVKELVENSIDSGAKNVSVEIKNGGIKFIRVTDDGSGMNEKNSELAFLRHATSKIKSVDDLYRIQTLGFRGEALPSIASVSLLDMLTRTKESLSGTRTKIEGGVSKDKREAGAPIGTSIIVREIFYNIPARRKFLKSILTETRHVIDLLTRFAIAYPEISFKLTSDEREVFDFKAVDNLKQRVGDIFGKNQMEKMVEMKMCQNRGSDTSGKGFPPPPRQVSVFGFLGKPEIARSNRAELYLFVNRRPITSRSLYHAVQMGYGELLPKGKFPFAIVFIEIDPELVDVNVHPTKSEVRFSDERGMHDLVYSKIKECLTSPEVMPTLSKLPESTMPPASASHDILRGWEPRLREVITSEDITPTSSAPPKAESFDLPVAELPKTKGEEGIHREQTQKSFFKEGVFEPESPKAQEIEEKKMPLSERPFEQVEDKLVEFAKVEKKVDAGAGNLWQLADTYILSQVKGNLMVLDQHAAHERILYEEAMKNLTQKPASSQQILFPTVMELSPKELQTFEVNKELIQKLGFEIKSFGGRSILVTAVPLVVKNRSGELFLREILVELEQEEKVEKNKLKAVAKSFACHAAVKSGDKLTQEEMSTLLHQLFATEEPYSCPHGRPTVVKISIDELNKKFGRG